MYERYKGSVSVASCAVTISDVTDESSDGRGFDSDVWGLNIGILLSGRQLNS